MAGVLDALNPTTIANYARGAWDGITINSWLLGYLKKQGAFSYDVGGDTLSGPIEAGRYNPTLSAPGMDLSSLFVPKVRHQRWNFSWAELVNALVIDRGLLRRNSGDQALVRLKDTEIPALFRDLVIGSNGFNYQFLQQDGAAYTGSGLPFYGLPSFLRNVSDATGGLLNGWDPAAKATTGAAAVTSMECACIAQTYGGLSLAPSGITGIDGLQYDAWMPVLVNSGYNWGGGANAEAANIELFLMHLINRLDRFSATDPSVKPDIGIVDQAYYRYLGAKKASREQIFVMTSQQSPDTPDTGYQPVKGLFHAGLTWKWEELMPANTAYAGCSKKVKIHIQPLYKDQENGSPLKVSGEEAGIMETAINFDPIRRQYLVSSTIPGQFTFEPRYWGCARPYKTA